MGRALKSKLFVIVLGVTVFLLAFIPMGMAQTQMPGVAKGDVLSYDFNIYWSNSSSQPPPYVLENNQTSSLRLVITNVSGSVVTWNQTAYFKRGTQVEVVGISDVAGSVPTGMFIFPANLSTNDTIGGGSYQLIINDTVPRTYPEGVRETNHICPVQYGDRYNIYVDKKTGVLVDYAERLTYTFPYYSTMVISYKLRSSSLWVVSEFPPFNFNVSAGGQTYGINAVSNSTVSALNFNPTSKELTFSVNGTSATRGFANITVPTSLMSGTFSLFKDGSLLVQGTDYTQSFNGTHYTFQIFYSQSLHTITIVSSQVIPELPTSFLTALMIMPILAGVVFVRKKLLKNQN